MQVSALSLSQCVRVGGLRFFVRDVCEKCERAERECLGCGERTNYFSPPRRKAKKKRREKINAPLSQTIQDSKRIGISGTSRPAHYRLRSDADLTSPPPESILTAAKTHTSDNSPEQPTRCSSPSDYLALRSQLTRIVDHVILR